ncbi:aspartate aminotransferase family protein [Rhodoligotrophos defluvii]|uniref:aspartate aminotransferase family protein n=1 Tax=Rhodoligotrophos defluvii TaxID=2561934 RepID=UPI0010CA0F3C|nr:aspartate aminotransferase family protein [Rhodoligotrophos defluvii]
MSHIIHRVLGATYPRAVAGDGAYIIDADGKRYLDASGGAAVSCLGHSERRVTEAIKAQLDAIPYSHTSFFTSAPAEELAALLAEQAPPGLDHVFLVSGGSEAMEAALKLARQYFVEKGEPDRRRFIARRQSFHGNTLGALAVGGNLARRALYDPLLIDVEHVSPCYAYRDKAADEDDEAYGARLAAELQATIDRHGAETIIAFVAETVVGATLGAVPAVPNYFRRIREICDRHGILLILDEVMCGMGRTGTMFACEQEGISPDIAVVAKGLGAGYQPIGALIASRAIYATLAAGSGGFQHGHTYLGHAAACAGALAVQKVIAEDGLLARVGDLGPKLMARLHDRFGQQPHVGDIRGRGLFLALELVEDRETKQPFDPALKLNARIKANAMAEGLMCYPMGGTIDGRRGDHVLLAPPYIVTEPQLDELVEKLDRALARSLAEISIAA